MEPLPSCYIVPVVTKGMVAIYLTMHYFNMQKQEHNNRKSMCSYSSATVGSKEI